MMSEMIVDKACINFIWLETSNLLRQGRFDSR